MIKKHFLPGIFLLCILAIGGGSLAHAQAIGASSGSPIGASNGSPIGASGGSPIGASDGCTSSGSSSGALVNPLKAQCINQLIDEIMGTVVNIGAVFLTLMLIYVGFLFVQARGNEEKISSARSALLWTVIGGLILLGAQAIASAIATTATSL